MKDSQNGKFQPAISLWLPSNMVKPSRVKCLLALMRGAAAGVNVTVPLSGHMKHERTIFTARA